IGFQRCCEGTLEDGRTTMGIMSWEVDIGVLIQVFSCINAPDVRDTLPEGEYVTPSTVLSKSRRTTSQAMLSKVCVSYLTDWKQVVKKYWCKHRPHGLVWRSVCSHKHQREVDSDE